MSSQKCLSNIFDFSDLRKKPQSQSTIPISSDDDLNFSQNQNIIKSFKQLRDKLKIQSKQMLTLKQQFQHQSIKTKQASQMLDLTLQTNIQQKQTISSLSCQNQQLKKKLSLVKHTLQSHQIVQNQLKYLKQSSLELSISKSKLQQEHAALLQISTQQKLALESQIQRQSYILQTKNKNIQQLQAQTLSLKQVIIKLQNRLKKQQINYQQQIYLNKWSSQNYETQYLLQKISNYQKQISTLKNRIKKDKQKRIEMQDKIIQLQESSGLNQVRCQVYQGEIQVYNQKCNKYQQKNKQLKQKIQKINHQKLQIQEILADQLIKNQEFVNKLKQINHNQVNFIIKQMDNKLKMKNKEGKQSLIQQISKKYNYQEKCYSKQKENINKSVQKYKSIEKNHGQRTILSEVNKNKNIDNRKSSIQKKIIQQSNITFGGKSALCQNDIEKSAIQNRIRKDRQVMERKLKEKNLYRNIQTATTSFEKNKLRGDYISNFIDKIY